ncbi:MAG: major facilitator superfamily 1 [Sporomusa sp.]|jgi:MFS family permease|nr:major facilitator superfamily 1 [Sporomusa sp.]
MKIKDIEVNSTQIGVLLIVWFAFLLSFVDRLAWPPVIPLASKALDLSAKQAGSYMTVFYAGYILTQIPGGLLTDRFGYRKVLLSSFLIMGLFTGLVGLTITYEQGLAFRLLAGFGSGAVMAASVRAIFEWFPPKGRGTAMGIFMTSTSLGLAVVNLTVPVLAQQYNWQAAFFVMGGITMAGFILGYFFLPERKKEPASQAAATSETELSTIQTLAVLIKNKNLMIFGIAGFCAMWGTWGVATWANSYLVKGLKLSLVQAGSIMSVYGLVALLAKPIAGVLADYFEGKIKYLFFWMMIFFGPALILFGMNTNVSMLYVLMPLVGITAFIYSPLLYIIVGELVPKNMIGTASGLSNAIWQLGSLISPLVFGAVLDATNSYFYGFVSLAVGPIIGAFLVLLLKIKK